MSSANGPTTDPGLSPAIAPSLGTEGVSASTSLSEGMARIAEEHPDVRKIVDRWLDASMPPDQSLVMMILELSRNLGHAENALREASRKA